MISFVNIFLIVCCYLSLAKALHYVVLAPHTVFHCSNHDHFIVQDWKKFQSSNASCPYDLPLSQQLLNVFKITLQLLHCESRSKTVTFAAYLDIASSSLDGIESITDEQLKQLSVKLAFGNRTYSLIPKGTNNSQQALFYQIRLRWPENDPTLWYIEFQSERIICIFEMICQALIFNASCETSKFLSSSFCYHDPSPPPMNLPENMRWKSLYDFLHNSKFLPENWRNIDWFLFDSLSFRRTKTTVSELLEKKRDNLNDMCVRIS